MFLKQLAGLKKLITIAIPLAYGDILDDSVIHMVIVFKEQLFAPSLPESIDEENVDQLSAQREACAGGF